MTTATTTAMITVVLLSEPEDSSLGAGSSGAGMLFCASTRPLRAGLAAIKSVKHIATLASEPARTHAAFTACLHMPNLQHPLQLHITSACEITLSGTRWEQHNWQARRLAFTLCENG